VLVSVCLWYVGNTLGRLSSAPVETTGASDVCQAN